MGGEGGFRPTASPGLHGQRCHACHSRCPEEGDLAEQEAVLSSGVTQHHRAVCVLDPRPPISRGAALAGGGQGMLMGPQFPHLQKGANSGFLTEQLGRLNETQPLGSQPPLLHKMRTGQKVRVRQRLNTHMSFLPDGQSEEKP